MDKNIYELPSGIASIIRRIAALIYFILISNTLMANCLTVTHKRYQLIATWPCKGILFVLC